MGQSSNPAPTTAAAKGKGRRCRRKESVRAMAVIASEIQMNLSATVKRTRKPSPTSGRKLASPVQPKQHNIANPPKAEPVDPSQGRRRDMGFPNLLTIICLYDPRSAMLPVLCKERCPSFEIPNASACSCGLSTHPHLLSICQLVIKEKSWRNSSSPSG